MTKFLQAKTSIKPAIGIICGSGLGGLANLIKDATSIDYKDIPGFPVSTGELCALCWDVDEVED